MNAIVVQRSHHLGVVKAKRLAEMMARRLRDEYGGTYAWDGNTLAFRRTGASGAVTVTGEGLEVRVEIGLLLMPLRSRIEREIQAFCDEHFGEDATLDRRRATRTPPRRREASKSSRRDGASRSARPT
jgi:putative polyhydroxyalkanoate system protein